MAEEESKGKEFGINVKALHVFCAILGDGRNEVYEFYNPMMRGLPIGLFFH